MLAQRLELLEEVGRLQASLGVQGDVSYTCETAAHFFLYQVSRQKAELARCRGPRFCRYCSCSYILKFVII